MLNLLSRRFFGVPKEPVMSASRCIASALSLFTLILVTSPATWADDLYVDNRVGDDIYDGRRGIVDSAGHRSRHAADIGRIDGHATEARLQREQTVPARRQTHRAADHRATKTQRRGELPAASRRRRQQRHSGAQRVMRKRMA